MGLECEIPKTLGFANLGLVFVQSLRKSPSIGPPRLSKPPIGLARKILLLPTGPANMLSPQVPACTFYGGPENYRVRDTCPEKPVCPRSWAELPRFGNSRNVK